MNILRVVLFIKFGLITLQVYTSNIRLQNKAILQFQVREGCVFACIQNLNECIGTLHLAPTQFVLYLVSIIKLDSKGGITELSRPGFSKTLVLV